MRIEISGGERNVHISLPTGWIFTSGGMWLGMRLLKMENISWKAARRCAEVMQQYREQHGSWDLVEVCSADGEQIRITL